MVFLTLACCARTIRNPGPNPFWKREQIRRLAGRFYGRQRNCVRLAQNAWRRALRFAVWGRAAKRVMMINLWETRLEGAANEHGMTYRHLKEGLAMSNVMLNRKVLQDLAIYEPRTFESLTALSKQRLHEEGLFESTIPPQDGVVTRGMLESPFCEGNRHLYPGSKDPTQQS
ncbi:large ribosomal subunit protein bL20m-like [Lineus longissimus]|uniref:large ribosomal subunit protein bL20m-like n=1 Tax=Lineus longissimus TaxID=88925 RepID=UPI002B4D1E7D